MSKKEGKKEEKIIRLRRLGKPKGRQTSARAREEVLALLNGAPTSADCLIENLHILQDAHGHLSAEHLAALAEVMRLPMAAVYETATFYHHFNVVKEGEAAPPPVVVRVCASLSCALAGGERLLQDLRQQLKGKARVIPAPCVGRCAGAPVAVAGQNAVENADVKSMVAAVAKKQTQAAPPPRARRYADYCKAGGYAIYAQCAAGERQPEEAIAELEKSGLRGLGGAGFGVGRKWSLVRAEAGRKAVAVNIDEGEPGTFKDRFYLEQEPHQFIEGALIAAWAVGADEIWIYLRDEYHGCRLLLQEELAALRAGAPFALPRLELRRGAGAYICGEESAMIESIEGKRGEPRLRPPYVAQVGLFNRPTLEHNMETLHWVPRILADGGREFAAAGRRGRRGWRSFSVSGRVAKPGVHVAPAGITLRELIDEHCGGMAKGHDLYAYLPGGASGGILPASKANIPLDFDTVQQGDANCFIGSAAVIVLSQQDSARDAALNVMRFFEDESCGQCTPCRVGTAKAAALMTAKKWDAALLEELSQAMADASICGLGQAAPNPIRCVLKHFPQEVS